MTYVKNNIYFGPEKPLITGNDAVALRKIFALLRNATGHDFSLYKQKTIGRRIFRRMAVCNVDDIVSYAKYLVIVLLYPDEYKTMVAGIHNNNYNGS
jgi:chemotaxis methyl-accepting protein methylase